ncbi:MAG: hypothetical protein IPK64_10805 [bacterium]|nr:hypothetical protein [bacterium]
MIARPLPRPRSGSVTVALWLAFLAVSFYKMRAYGLDGRFWAEEGRDFFPALIGSEAWRGIVFLYNGHLELATNLVVTLATRVELASAPLVTTWLSWAVQALPVGLLIHARGLIGLSSPRALLFVFATAALPQSAEVWANSINLHFHLALLAGLIALLPTMGGRAAWGLRALLLAAGLGGIPPNALLPVFVWRASRERSRERGIQAGVLGVTTVLQLVLLAAQGFDLQGRDSVTSPLLLWMALLAQHVVSPLLGMRLSGPVIGWFDVLHGGGGTAWALALALSAASLAFMARVARRGPDTARAALAAAGSLAVFCVLTSLGNREVLVSTDVGGRYFYAPNLLLLVCLLLAVPPVRAPGWRLAVLVWVLFALPGLKVYLGGPPWPEALARARQAEATRIELWPAGWTMDLPAGYPALK